MRMFLDYGLMWEQRSLRNEVRSLTEVRVHKYAGPDAGGPTSSLSATSDQSSVSGHSGPLRHIRGLCSLRILSWGIYQERSALCHFITVISQQCTTMRVARRWGCLGKGCHRLCSPVARNQASIQKWQSDDNIGNSQFLRAKDSMNTHHRDLGNYGKDIK